MSSEDMNQEKKDTKEKFSVSGFGNNMQKSFKDHKAEFDKITWPNRKDLLSKTITVIVTSLFFGVIIFGLDSIYQVIFKFVTNLVG